MEFYQPGQSGVYRDRPDFRDLKISEVMGAPQVDWEKGFNAVANLNLKVENQNGSLSCVGQAFSKYAEILNYFDTGELKDLSAKFIYGQIYLPQGGSYLRDAAKLLVNKGCSEESLVPSYPATEDHFRDLILNQEILDNAIKYQAKEYRTTNSGIDELALAIQLGHGAVTAFDGTNEGWASAFIKPPKSPNVSGRWSHAVLALAYKLIDGVKYIGGINSWGEKWGQAGWWWASEDYFITHEFPGGMQANFSYPAWTIIDKPNEGTMKHLEGRELLDYLVSSFVSGVTKKDKQKVENSDALTISRIRKQMVDRASKAPLSIIVVDDGGKVFIKPNE